MQVRTRHGLSRAFRNTSPEMEGSEQKDIAKTFILNERCTLDMKDLWVGETFVISELNEIEHSLYNCKLRIRSALCENDYQDPLEDQNIDDTKAEAWHAHTSARDPAGLIVPFLRQNFNPEMCTNAWAKFYEILSSYPDITSKASRLVESTEVDEGAAAGARKFVSVHLCEAPGAFISALNHFLVLRCRTGDTDTPSYQNTVAAPSSDASILATDARSSGAIGGDGAGWAWTASSTSPVSHWWPRPTRGETGE